MKLKILIYFGVEKNALRNSVINDGREFKENKTVALNRGNKVHEFSLKLGTNEYKGFTRLVNKSFIGNEIGIIQILISNIKVSNQLKLPNCNPLNLNEPWIDQNRLKLSLSGISDWYFCSEFEFRQKLYFFFSTSVQKLKWQYFRRLMLQRLAYVFASGFIYF